MSQKCTMIVTEEGGGITSLVLSGALDDSSLGQLVMEFNRGTNLTERVFVLDLAELVEANWALCALTIDAFRRLAAASARLVVVHGKSSAELFGGAGLADVFEAADSLPKALWRHTEQLAASA